MSFSLEEEYIFYKVLIIKSFLDRKVIMKFLLISQYYFPESGSASMRMTELAEYLASRGHNVTVVTGFPNYPQGRIYKGYRLKVIQKEKVNGVKIIRVPLYPTLHRKSFKLRMINYVTFMFTSIYGGLVAKKPDLIYYYSPPLFIGISAWVLKKIYRVPTVVEINDLWPQAPIALKVIKNKIFIKLAEALERFVYKKTDYLFFYSNTHRKTIVNKGIDQKKTEIHPLWVSTTEFSPRDMKEVGEVRDKLKLNGKFVVMYAGVIGMAQGLDVVVETANKLRDYENIVFVLIGDGAEKENLIKRAEQLKLSNVLFVPFQPVNIIPKFLSAADTLIVHLTPAPHRIGTIPAKVLAYMSIGKPILVAAQGETSDLVKRSGAGLVVKPGSPDALAEGVLSLNKDKSLEAMGVAGREYALKNFDREKILSSLERRLIELPRDVKNLEIREAP